MGTKLPSPRWSHRSPCRSDEWAPSHSAAIASLATGGRGRCDAWDSPIRVLTARL